MMPLFIMPVLSKSLLISRPYVGNVERSQRKFAVTLKI